jgi:hypothetical protein
MTKPTSDSQAEILFGEIVRAAKHPKSQRAIDRIKSACDYLEERKIEISATEVAIFCKPSPALQSIHNNRKFKDYITVRRAQQKVPVSPEFKELKFVSKDPDTAAAFYALEVQIRREKTEKQNLRRALELSGEYDLQATLSTGRLVKDIPNVAPEVAKLPAVLRRLLDLEHLRKFGLEIVTERVIAPNRNGRVFMERDDFRIIWKVATSKS